MNLADTVDSAAGLNCFLHSQLLIKDKHSHLKMYCLEVGVQEGNLQAQPVEYASHFCCYYHLMDHFELVPYFDPMYGE